MSYFTLDKFPKGERIRVIGEFYDVIDSLKNRQEVREFLKDLLTPNEIGNLMRRVEVALLLILGFSYDEISQMLRVSKDKVLNVHKKLVRGGKGYEIVIQRLLEKRKKRKIREIKYQKKLARKIKSEFEGIKKKYPLHFLLVNLIDEFSDHLYALSKLKSPKEEAKSFYKNRKID